MGSFQRHEALNTSLEHQASVSGVDQCSNAPRVPSLRLPGGHPSQKGAGSRDSLRPERAVEVPAPPEKPSHIRLQRLRARPDEQIFLERAYQLCLERRQRLPEGTDGMTLMLLARTGPAHSDPTCQFPSLGPKLGLAKQERDYASENSSRLPPDMKRAGKADNLSGGQEDARGGGLPDVTVSETEAERLSLPLLPSRPAGRLPLPFSIRCSTFKRSWTRTGATIESSILVFTPTAAVA